MLSTKLPGKDVTLEIVLLPGMDGTGALFAPLVAHLPETLSIHIVSLNDLQGDSYTEQAINLNKRFSNAELFIVAESYSGRIAYEFCTMFKEQVVGLTLVASFISAPSFVSKFAALLPSYFIKPNIATNIILNKIGFDGKATQREVAKVFASVSNNDPNNLKQRLTNIQSLDYPTEIVKVPTTYIRPTKDRLVNQKAISVIGNVFEKLKVVEVDSGHFVAQMHPKTCAEIIVSAIEESLVT